MKLQHIALSSSLVCSVLVAAVLCAVPACSNGGGDDSDNEDEGNGGAEGDESGSDSSSGGAGGEGSGSGGAAPGSGGASSSAQFEGTIYVNLELTVGPSKLGVYGVFVEPGSATQKPVEGQLDPLVRVITGLEVGECGVVVYEEGDLDISPVEVGSAISLSTDDTELSVPAVTDQPGFYSSYSNSSDFPLEVPVDLGIEGQGEIESGVVAAFGFIPAVDTIPPALGCSTTDGCEFGINSSGDLDEVYISFTAGEDQVVCRGNAATKKVVVPGGMLTAANWGRLYGLTRIQEELNGSPIQFVLVSSDDAYLSATDPS